MTVELRYSGGTGNQFAIASLGGEMSSVPIPDAQLLNLFDDVTRVEVINGRKDHRCFWIFNDGAQDYRKMELITLGIPADTEIEFAVDQDDVQQLLNTEDQVPVGLTFFAMRNWDTLEIPIGTLDIGDKIAIWIKRKVNASSVGVKTIAITIDAVDNTLVITQDFKSLENSFDNIKIRNRSPQFFTDIDFVGESLLS